MGRVSQVKRVCVLLGLGWTAWGGLAASPAATDGPPSQRQINEAIRKGRSFLLKTMTPEGKREAAVAEAEAAQQASERIDALRGEIIALLKDPGKKDGPEHLALQEEISGLMPQTRTDQHRDRAVHLAAYALIASGVPREDPVVKGLLDETADRIRNGEEDNYDLAVSILALTAGLSKGRKHSEYEKVSPLYHKEVVEAVKRLVGHQLPSGCWNYRGPEDLKEGQIGGKGDVSNAQFAVLGLSAAWRFREIRPLIPRDTWEKVEKGFAAWYMEETSKSQGREVGGWPYHASGDGRRVSGTMTCAGICSMILAKAALTGKPLKEIKPNAVGLIKPALGYLESVDLPKLFDGKEKKKDVHRYYHLYSLERTGTLCHIQTIGKYPWYEKGAGLFLAEQNDDGSWIAAHSKTVDTSFALLFLCRATNQTYYGVYDIGDEAEGKPAEGE